MKLNLIAKNWRKWVSTYSYLYYSCLFTFFCEINFTKKLFFLGLQDWARLWRQILKDLRDGVKLKKIDYTKTPFEYELTPYEILMEDIR